MKGEGNPVTSADEQAEHFLVEELSKLLPGVNILAEESCDRSGFPLHGSTFLLVDALDGTREFIELGREFTVNIALVEGGKPRAGAICAPALNQTWCGGEQAFSAITKSCVSIAAEDWRSIRTRPRPENGLTAVWSRYYLDAQTKALLARLPLAASSSVGASLKFCRIAEGSADVYPRLSPAMEWDIAAGDAILTAAGGAVFDARGEKLRYGKRWENYRVGQFVAWGDPQGASLFQRSGVHPV